MLPLEPLNPYTVIKDFPDFIAIDKAPGVSVHRDQAERGLVETVAAEQGYSQLFLVHRLDRITSGLLLLAKSSAACARLARLFEQREVEKYYLALAEGKPLKKQGLIQGDMQRTRNGSWRLDRTCTDPAITRFFSLSARPGLRLFTLRPSTGKTHQLRVALKSLGTPILGDQRYGGLAADRGYLHAAALRFDYEGESIELCAPPTLGRWFNDSEVAAALATQATPWTLPWVVKVKTQGQDSLAR